MKNSMSRALSVLSHLPIFPSCGVTPGEGQTPPMAAWRPSVRRTRKKRCRLSCGCCGRSSVTIWGGRRSSLQQRFAVLGLTHENTPGSLVCAELSPWARPSSSLTNWKKNNRSHKLHPLSLLIIFNNSSIKIGSNFWIRKDNSDILLY